VLIGQFAPYFWLFVAIAGIVPLLLVALPRTRTVPGIVVAAGLVVAGMWLKRMLIVVPAATNPLIDGSWGDFRLTWVVVAVTVAGVAAIPLLLMLFFKLVPILAVAEIEEIATEAAGLESRAPVLAPSVALSGEGGRP
jgi:molybdopterin-containing oxidoreductase family membrane subunit